MCPLHGDATVGAMLSGGLDSAILLGHLAAKGYRIQPFYVESHLVWQTAELRATHRFLAEIGRRWGEIDPLVVLELPLRDVYGRHWSTTGSNPPDAGSDDTAVYLPGRNILLLVKAALWCQLHGIEQVALGVLGTNPFADATTDFFRAFETVIHEGTGGRVCVIRPFAGMTKREVMELGRGLPLELTFSCIAPVSGQHCGRCNKCAERQAAFRLIDAPDPTRYHQSTPSASGSSGSSRPTRREDAFLS